MVTTGPGWAERGSSWEPGRRGLTGAEGEAGAILVLVGA